jgi:Ala-tRNA(Pro) deacylase
MPTRKLRDYLDQHEIQYVTISHSPAYTAQRIAELTRIPGKELAKTKIDNKFAMAVLPASRRVNLEHLKEAIGADDVTLSSETEFNELFPDCEVGAMPPFGNLYDMGVYVAEQLTEDEFNAGTHSELVKMSYNDYANLVTPQVVALT